jgi:predicted DsbA family dithiol-disulfide isomerase
MLKLLIITLLLSSVSFANDIDTKIENFLKKSFKVNRNIVSLKVKVIDKVKVTKLEGWDAFIVSVDATLKAKPKNRHVKQKMIWFSNGTLITQDLIDMKTTESLKDLVSPQFKPEHYKKENLIYGDENAKHKVAIFSDPLCPFCRSFVPGAIKEMKERPKEFAIYYYHLPLNSLHPAAVELVKAATVAQLQGHADVVLNLYKVKVNSHERDVKKILAAFNKVMKTDIKPKDLKSPEVMKHYNSDMKIVDELMVQGTPTMYFDGKLDKSKRKYKEVK